MATLDPSIYNQVGRVNMGAGLSDILNEQRAREAQAEQRQNTLAAMAMQQEDRQMSLADRAAQQQAAQLRSQQDAGKSLNMWLANAMQSGRPIEEVLPEAIAKGAEYRIDPERTTKHVQSVYASGATPQDRAMSAAAQAMPEKYTERLLTPPKAERTYTKEVIGPDGKPIIVSEAESLGMAPYKPAAPVSDVAQKRLDLEREKFEFLKKNPAIAKQEGWKYDAGSDTWVQPPTQEFPQGRATQSAGKTGAVQNFEALAFEMLGDDKTPGLVDKVQSGGTLGVFGKLAPVTDKDNFDNFNNIRESMSTEYRKIFRIPGEGALSDKEQAQYGVQLPSTNYNASVNRDIVKRGMLRIKNAMQEGNNPLIGRERVATAYESDDAEAVAWAQANPNDPRAAQIMSLHGR